MPGEKVLIIEDHVVPEGRALQRKLTRAGYEVVGIAETAETAFRLAIEKRPVVVLVDIELQGDGLAGIRAATRIQNATGAQIIYVTGVLVDEELLAETRKTPDSQFLTKPVPKTQLYASVRLAVLKAQGKGFVFLCYSHRDAEFANELLNHIQPLQEIGIQPFVDTDIQLGRRWKHEIEKALDKARAAICLVSIHFVNSPFIREVELPKLFKAAADQSTPIIPVFVQYVDKRILERTGLLDFQGINGPENPIAAWPEPRRHQDCWGRLCKRLQTDLP